VEERSGEQKGKRRNRENKNQRERGLAQEKVKKRRRRNKTTASRAYEKRAYGVKWFVGAQLLKNEGNR
jgi:hypothetical protein